VKCGRAAVKFSYGEVDDVFPSENEKVIKTGAAFATLSQSAVCFASAASTSWSAAFRASSKIMDVFACEN